MRYKVYYGNPDRTLSRLSKHIFLRKYNEFVSIGGEVKLRSEVARAFKETKDGVYYRSGFRLYCIPESHHYFNYDILYDGIKLIPLTNCKIGVFTLFRQVGTAFYNYIRSIINTK